MKAYLIAYLIVILSSFNIQQSLVIAQWCLKPKKSKRLT